MVTKDALSVSEVPGIKAEAKKQGVLPEKILYSRGIKEEVIREAKGELYNIPTRELKGQKVDFRLLREIPEESARFYKFVPLGESDGTIEIGILEPDEVSAQQALKFISARIKKPFKLFVITPSDLDAVLQQYKSIGGEVTKALSEFEQETGDDVVLQTEDEATKVSFSAEAPITKIVDVIVRHAVEEHASDIHIEPQKEGVRVRFRIDGVLHTNLTLPLASHHAIINRIKILTKMKIDETRIPQDGRFHAEVGDHGIDFRVATLPTPYGEKVAIRILDSEAGVKTLEDLGFRDRNLELMKQSIKRPYGMILVTGPTGSGKSTTLYAILQLLNQEGVNIVSLEDPVEYYIPGMNQSQVRPEINYDFAGGLRNILRQDPDIIMVGEIRDKETAQLATQAALTGHLVISTLHTNNALGVIPRLIDMGVDPFLLPSTLILMVAQRLARKLCPDSRALVESGPNIDLIEEEVKQMPQIYRDQLELKRPWQIYKGVPSPACPKGTSGRIGVYESFVMTPELQKIIADGATEGKLSEEVARQNMFTMRQDGIMKVLDGIMGVEELLEVT